MAESADDAVVSEDDLLHKKITDAFQVFDTNNNSSVDVKDTGTIMYSLGCFPSQKDIDELKAEVEDNNTGIVFLDKFLPAMTKVLQENKFPPISEDVLLQAFEVLDREQKGYLDSEEMIEYMTKEGDAFTEEEMTEMLSALADNEEKIIYYKDVISELTFEPGM
ncbi:dynein regulatory complex 8 [Solea senegalensis]|uniref:Dynein regulatory complex 8 n=1 Tax=Solea senegalensis TaxID=28829 RepID=A0AAV6SJQ5_SOLSE|nr:dynein regulatory complex protein 8-like [Solea senegalensis]KAG7517734.1 dynein regulatory complex 8 [Solea senegalensis]